MSTELVMSVTDELIAELEQLAKKAGAMALDTAEEVEAQSGRMIECPICCGEGYASAENDYCNFDNHAIGVEFYGIGQEFGLAEAYFRAASPAVILALLAERSELKRDAERYIAALNYIIAHVDGNIRPTVRDCVNGMNYVQDIYDYCDQIEAAIDAAMQS